MTPLCGLVFPPLSLARAAEKISQRPEDAAFDYVVTPNADHLVRLARDPELLAIYRRAGLCLLDSRVVAGLARLLGVEVPPVIPGSDLTALLLERHVRLGETVTIVGLSADRVGVLEARYGLGLSAHHQPPMGFADDPAAWRGCRE
jgi:N-acetylglucosaminyldiphosphoundecaprenol N-acetyl-beta-D-mannosaminyltransferase